MNKFMTVVAVLAIAAIAQAGTITVAGDKGGSLDVQITYLGPVVSPLGTTVDEYNVTLYASAAGDSVSAIDLTFTPGTSNMYQESRAGNLTPEVALYVSAGFPAVFSPVWTGPCDTHFNITTAQLDGNSNPLPSLTPQQWIALVRPANENNDGSVGGPNVNGNWEGWGTSLDCASGVTPVLQTSDLANITVAVGGNALLNGAAAAVDGEKFTFNNIIIPEPATLGLLAMGGVGVLLRKRR